MRRVLAGISQERLGAALGVTFQQVQKYEKGSNRISASRLQQIGGVLGVTAAYFFEGAPNVKAFEFVTVDNANLIDVSSFLLTPEGARLGSAFIRVTSAKVRRRIVDLVEDLASSEIGRAD